MVIHNTVILNWLEAKEAQPPLLLLGHSESVLQELARSAALGAVCTSTNKPCQVCQACKQALGNIHPDVVVVAGEEKTIRMKEIKALLETVRNTPLHGRRLVVIPQAERLSAAAVSALLKTLEEPGPGTRFLLWSGYKRRILKTILSRCMIVPIMGPQQISGIDESVPRPVFGQHTGPLQEEELAVIYQALAKQLRAGRQGPELVKAFTRLKDYYKIRSVRGNEKLASEVLLATLDQLQLSASRDKV